MPATLQVLSGNNPGTKYELIADKVRLGRHPDCEVQITLDAVSRYHATIWRLPDGYYVEDLNSRNGTFVNSRKIEGRTKLNNQDRVKICDALFVFSNESALGAMPTIPPEEDEEPSTVLTSIDAESSAETMVKVQAEAKLRAVLEITQALGRTTDLNALFGNILESLFKIFPQADRGMIILENHGKLVPSAMRHRRQHEDSARFSRTIVWQAMNDRKAILSADAGNDSRFAMSQSIADFRIRSIMCVPLLAADRGALGVIQLDTQSYHQQFNEDDLQILNAVGNQASISLVNTQLHEQRLAQERVNRELAFAREVQKSFLPHAMPKFSPYSFWAFYEAAGQVGGDYYDFIQLPNGKLGVALGDVSGKGIPAALLMAKASSDTRVALFTHSENTEKAIADINNAICRAGLEDKFMTMALCLLEPSDHSMSIVNAGHMSPMIRRTDGAIDEPADERMSGLPLGVLEDYEYDSVETLIDPGESVLLFSDGINEAMDAAESQYTSERLKHLLATHDLPPNELGPLILSDVRAHVAGYKQSDDMTMVIFRRNPE